MASLDRRLAHHRFAALDCRRQPGRRRCPADRRRPPAQHGPRRQPAAVLMAATVSLSLASTDRAVNLHLLVLLAATVTLSLASTDRAVNLHILLLMQASMGSLQKTYACWRQRIYKRRKIKQLRDNNRFRK